MNFQLRITRPLTNAIRRWLSPEAGGEKSYPFLRENGFTLHQDQSVTPPMGKGRLRPKDECDFKALDYLYGSGERVGVEQAERLDALTRLGHQGCRFASYGVWGGVYPDFGLDPSYEPFFVYQLMRESPETEIWFQKQGASFPLTAAEVQDAELAADREALLSNLYNRDLAPRKEADPPTLVFRFWREFATEVLAHEPFASETSEFLAAGIEASRRYRGDQGNERDFRSARGWLGQALKAGGGRELPTWTRAVRRLSLTLSDRHSFEEAMELLARPVDDESLEDRAAVVCHAALRGTHDLKASYERTADRVFLQKDTARLAQVKDELKEHGFMGLLFDNAALGEALDVVDQGDFIVVGEHPLDRQL